MLTVKNLYFDYTEHPLLQNVNFTLNDGELLHLRGANGSGKTSLIKLLAGIFTPQDGEIYYQNQLISNNLAEYHQHLYYIGHKPSLSLLLSARENCFFDLKKSKKVDLAPLFYQLSLNDVMDMPCGLLSAGQKRKVGLIRLQLSSAKLWLLDEPFVALDEQAIHVLSLWCEEHLKKGGQIVLTSHQNIPFNAPIQEYLL